MLSKNKQVIEMIQLESKKVILKIILFNQID